MSIQLISSVLINTETSGVTNAIWEGVSRQLREKGVENIPQFDATQQNKQQVASFLESNRDIFTTNEQDKLAEDIFSESHKTATTLRVERMKHTTLTFKAAYIVSIVATLIILFGIAIIVWKGMITKGVITAIVGAAGQVVGTILFRLNNDTNKFLDKASKDLYRIEAAKAAIIMVDKIEDPKKRDNIISETVKNLMLQSKPGEQL